MHWKIISITAITITIILAIGAIYSYKASESIANMTESDTGIPKILIAEIEKDLPETYNEKNTFPDSIHHDVPFTAQAPFGNWQDKRQETSCEEASVIMAIHWAKNKTLTPEEALKKITAISDYELETYGYFEDTSAKDTLERIIKSYFKYANANLVYGINVDDIRKELAENRLVIVPVNGRMLANPYYTPPGPTHHMIVIVGYDDIRQEFITHDPGTKYGENFRYSYKNTALALQDYKSGKNELVQEKRTAMIIVGK